MLAAETTVRHKVVIILGDVFVEGNDGSVEAGIVDRDVPAFAFSRGSMFELALPEFGSHRLNL